MSEKLTLEEKESQQERLRILSYNLTSKNFLIIINCRNKDGIDSIEEKNVNVITKKEFLETFINHPNTNFEFVKQAPKTFQFGTFYILFGLKRSRIYVYNKLD